MKSISFTIKKLFIVVCRWSVNHMDFISPHPPWLGGKEIQGEPRGTFWISSAPRGLATS